jgi:hypothetical protein
MRLRQGVAGACEVIYPTPRRRRSLDDEGVKTHLLFMLI